MNYLETLNIGNKILKKCDLENYRLDCEVILSKVLNKPREFLLTNLQDNIDQKNFNNFINFLKRREKKEPIAYIFEDLSRIKILYYLWLILSKGDLSRAKSIITKELDKLEINKIENKVLSQIDGEDFGFKDKLIIRKSNKSLNLLVP